MLKSFLYDTNNGEKIKFTAITWLHFKDKLRIVQIFLQIVNDLTQNQTSKFIFLGKYTK